MIVLVYRQDGGCLAWYCEKCGERSTDELSHVSKELQAVAHHDVCQPGVLLQTRREDDENSVPSEWHITHE